MSNYNIAIIGSGVVGTATGKGFHKMGHNVTFFDISRQRLLTLREEGYDITLSMKDAIARSDISFVCVNTPQAYEQDPGKHQDLSQLLAALREIVNALNDDITYKKRFLVFRSTMLPGTMRNVVLDYLEANCSLKHGKDYEVLYNPEFLRQDSALEDFFTPDRIVIGQKGESSSSPLLDLYIPLTKNIILMGYEEAEMAKYASNCFLALKISYFNELGMICKKMGVNEELVNLAVSMDKRIGKYGTKAGRPFDGACFPKDTEAFASFARKLNVKPDLVETAISINKQMDNMNSPRLYVKEQVAKDQYIREPEI